jgi:hypothetical protein
MLLRVVGIRNFRLVTKTENTQTQMSSNMHIERVCKFCNSKFIAGTTKTQYCSNKCSSKAYKQASRQEKVEIAKVEATISGKIRTTVNFPLLAGKKLLTITEATRYSTSLM